MAFQVGQHCMAYTPSRRTIVEISVTREPLIYVFCCVGDQRHRLSASQGQLRSPIHRPLYDSLYKVLISASKASFFLPNTSFCLHSSKRNLRTVHDLSSFSKTFTRLCMSRPVGRFSLHTRNTNKMCPIGYQKPATLTSQRVKKPFPCLPAVVLLDTRILESRKAQCTTACLGESIKQQSPAMPLSSLRIVCQGYENSKNQNALIAWKWLYRNERSFGLWVCCCSLALL